MTTDEIKKMIAENKSYDFLRTNEHLKDNIICLGLGGSYAYGTNLETSDVDVRGIALNSKDEILQLQDFEQIVNSETDTTIYSIHKIFSLLSNCNPNTIEMLGLKPEHYIYTDSLGIWDTIYKNRKIFLSKRAINSFGGYANAQLRRLENREAKNVSMEKQQEHILKSIKFAREATSDNLNLNLYVDKSTKEDLEYEIFADLDIKHYSFRDMMKTLNEYSSIVRQYDSLGKPNSYAIEHGRLGKHMMHLVRLYLMCFDILNEHEIITYREKEHDMLMSIRNGEYLTADNQVKPEFYRIVDELEKKLQKYAEETTLPKNPDYDAINNLLRNINYATIMRK